MGKGKTADLHKHWKKDKLSIKQRQKDKLTKREKKFTHSHRHRDKEANKQRAKGGSEQQKLF